MNNDFNIKSNSLYDFNNDELWSRMNEFAEKIDYILRELKRTKSRFINIKKD